MNDWVTILTFTFPHEAYIAQSLLDAEGVTTFLKDELTIGIHNFYSNAVGGVKLQVPSDEAERAVEILKDSGYVD